MADDHGLDAMNVVIASILDSPPRPQARRRQAGVGIERGGKLSPSGYRTFRVNDPYQPVDGFDLHRNGKFAESLQVG